MLLQAIESSSEYEGMKYVERTRDCQPGWRQKVDRVLDTFLPCRCLVCGLSSGPGGLCVQCTSGLPFCTEACPRCGLPLGAGRASACGACQRHPPLQNAVFGALWYEFPARQLITRYKFQRNTAAGGALSRLLSEQLVSRKASLPSALVPVPLHPWRLFHRGFNQAYDIARLLGNDLGIKLRGSELRRTRHTPRQSGLEAKARRRNLAGAFYWRGRPLAGDHLALVDDVMTTGSTVRECCKVLKQAGADRVDVWVVARAQGHA